MAQQKRRSPGQTRKDKCDNWIAALEALRTNFDARSAERKIKLIKRLRRCALLDAGQLITYHDTLSFLRAYPESASFLKLTEAELQAFAGRVELYLGRSKDRQGRKLFNSGLCNTAVKFAFGYDATRHLLRWYPRSLELDWDTITEEEADAILGILPLLVSWPENDALDNDPVIDGEEWLKESRGKRLPSDLMALMNLFVNSALPVEIQRHLFEDLDFELSWQLAQSAASRTLARVPAQRKYYQRGPLRGRTADLGAELTKPPAPLQLLSKREGMQRVRTINEVLYVRYRELFPITFANPAEVYVSEPGRGLQLFIFGSLPEVRLPLEANFGAMFVRNGIPIGYGVGATLFDRVEIAINIFPAFRSGESAFVIEQFFRLFYHHFGSRLLLVRSRQMGDGDDEPLKSGAFWFYYKLGFRAVKQRIRKLADEEHQQLKSAPGSRSPIRMLKRLSKSDVVFCADSGTVDDYRELSLANLGHVVTEHFAREYNGNRRLGIAASVARVARVLKLTGWKKWPAAERQALEHLAPLVACIPDLARWPQADKASLGRWIRAKGAVRERRFVLLSCRHTRLEQSLRRLADSYQPEE